MDAAPFEGVTVVDLGQIYNAPYATLLLALGGAIGMCAIRKPRRDVAASRCAGGQLVGAPSAIADAPDVAMPESPRVRAPARRS